MIQIGLRFSVGNKIMFSYDESTDVSAHLNMANYTVVSAYWANDVSTHWNLANCTVIPVGFVDVDGSDSMCGLLRCVDPNYLDAMDSNALNSWRPYHT